MRPRSVVTHERGRVCVSSCSDEEAEDKHKGQFGLSPLCFYRFCTSLIHFLHAPFDGHPNQGQTEDLFQNSQGKITKLKKTRAKSQLDRWIGAITQFSL
jgi:hypothetical protein